MKYFDILSNWQRIRPHLAEPEIIIVLQRDLNKYALGRWGFPFATGALPKDYDCCDWRKGREPNPAFWDYVCHGASHWLVNFNLKLAQRVERRDWQIVTSPCHSSVWDGEETWFDFNLSALEVPPDDVFLFETADDRTLTPGRQRRPGFPTNDYQTPSDPEMHGDIVITFHPGAVINELQKTLCRQMALLRGNETGLATLADQLGLTVSEVGRLVKSWCRIDTDCLELTDEAGFGDLDINDWKASIEQAKRDDFVKHLPPANTCLDCAYSGSDADDVFYV
jgi:hypothetical protein